jgi:DNA-binding PadR family transcriptional regulator
VNELKQLFEIVEHVAATRPSYSLPNFLPRQVLELGVLNALESGDRSGDQLIRELAPLSRRASRGFGVNYPMLHEMEADGLIKAYQPNDSRRRFYTLTEQGQTRFQQLEGEYSSATPEQFQTGLSLVWGLNQLDVATHVN